MQVAFPTETGVFDDRQVSILSEAFEEALLLLELKDRSCISAQALAIRVIAHYSKGERDPKQIARKAAEN
jgi:hypothetical protein